MTTERILQSVLGALRASGEDCFLEDTMALCPHLTWNQVFLAVDDLSRTGRVRMTRDAGEAIGFTSLSSCRSRRGVT